MATRHYSPQISRVLVCALYHEAKRRRVPMTTLVDELVGRALSNSEALRTAHRAFCSSPNEEKPYLGARPPLGCDPAR
jgi:hypothetical protein